VEPRSEIRPSQATFIMTDLPKNPEVSTGENAPVEPVAPASPPELVMDPEGVVPVEAIETPEAGVEPLEAPLEPSGELEDPSAEIIDGDLDQLLQTPLGLKGAIEALLFATPEPLTQRRLANALGIKDAKVISSTVVQLQTEYDSQRRGIQIQETASGYQMLTRELFGPLILRLRHRKRRPTLSPAALETLAIVAYRQPIIRAELEAIRGVESSGVLRNLIDMGLVESVGRKEVLGRPTMYGTTLDFLHGFGLKDLDELPSISELKQRFKDQAVEEEVEAEGEEDSQEQIAAETGEEAESPGDEEANELEESRLEGDDEAGDESIDEEEDYDDDDDEDEPDEEQTPGPTEDADPTGGTKL
jgi:segregation and condensation protein B